jgi:hypothetical protein
MKPCSATVDVTPKDVMLKQELYFLMLFRKCLDSSEFPDMYDRRGSGGGLSDGNLTLPLEQHIPGNYRLPGKIYFFELWKRNCLKENKIFNLQIKYPFLATKFSCEHFLIN